MKSRSPRTNAYRLGTQCQMTTIVRRVPQPCRKTKIHYQVYREYGLCMPFFLWTNMLHIHIISIMASPHRSPSYALFAITQPTALRKSTVDQARAMELSIVDQVQPRKYGAVKSRVYVFRLGLEMCYKSISSTNLCFVISLPLYFHLTNRTRYSSNLLHKPNKNKRSLV